MKHFENSLTTKNFILDINDIGRRIGGIFIDGAKLAVKPSARYKFEILSLYETTGTFKKTG